MAGRILCRTIQGAVLLVVYECAIDPDTLASWSDRHTGRSFDQAFGVGKAHVMSRYPKRWKNLALQAFGRSPLSSHQENEARFRWIVTQLLEASVVRYGAQWNSRKDWLENAETEHDRIPFDLILANKNPRNRNRVMISSVVDEGSDRLESRKTCTVKRNREELAAIAAPLLRIASEIVFVDPYFRNNSRYCEAFGGYLERIVLNRPTRPPCLPINILTRERFSSDDRRQLEYIVPSSLSIRVVQLAARERGQQFHNRFILTNLGCMLFAHGLDVASDTRETTDTVSLLDGADCNDMWNLYGDQGDAFDRIDEFLVSGKRVA